MKINFKDRNISRILFDAEFGLEKECLRINGEGFISHTEHPFGDDPNIQKDFCESQTEFVTDVCRSADEVCNNLRSLQKKALGILKAQPNGREFLWPFSNPPYVRDESDIPVAVFDGEMQSKSLYREYLADKYGKMKMLYSGIHFNFSFSEKFLNILLEYSDEKTFFDFKNQIYLEISKKLVRYAWLIVYLTAASPVMDGSFFKSSAVEKTVLSGYSSPRCSEIGYWNDFEPVLSYDSIESYVSSINGYVAGGRLRSASELYYPVRLKPRGENSLDNLLAKGVNHIELRMLDDNPLSSTGIFKEDIEFIHILILYLLGMENAEFDNNSQITAVRNEKSAAKFDPNSMISFNGSVKSVREQAADVFADMERRFDGIDYALNIIAYQKNKKRYADIIAERFKNDYVKKGLALSKEYANEILNEE